MGKPAKVLRLPLEESKRPMPERWSAPELERLLRNAARLGFCKEEVEYATHSVRMWWETNRKPRTKWHLVVLNAMRQGWALRGFGREQERRGRRARTMLTDEVIGKLVARHKQEA